MKFLKRGWLLLGLMLVVLLAGCGDKTPEQMLEVLLDGLAPEINDTVPAVFACGCNRKKIEKVLISLGKQEIKDMIEEGNEIEVNCHFCGSHYKFSVDELKELYRKSK